MLEKDYDEMLAVEEKLDDFIGNEFSYSVEERWELFRKIVIEHVDRRGIHELMFFLRTEGFKEQPASTKWHQSYEGGLVVHSLQVLYMVIQCLKNMNEAGIEVSVPIESIIIASLFHDVDKYDSYILDSFCEKDGGFGYKWNNDKISNVGHASRSIVILSKYIDLTDQEYNAIYWHMGPWSEGNLNGLSEAYKDELAFAVNYGDMISTKFMK